MTRPQKFEFYAACAFALAMLLVLELVATPLSHHALPEPWADVMHIFTVVALVTWLARKWYAGHLAAERAALSVARISEDRFRSLTALSADWFWETDAENRIQWIAGGPTVLALFGAERAFGRRIWDIPGIEIAEDLLEAHLHLVGSHQAFHELEVRRRHEDGRLDFHLVSGEPCFDDAGGFAGYRGVGRDVSEQRRAGEALAEAKDRLELALGAGNLAIWDTDIACGRVFLSQGWKAMLGVLPSGDTVDLTALAEGLHPLDLEPVREASRRCVKGELPTFSVEMRVRAGSGEWKWLVATGRVTKRDERGWAQRMSGVVVDVDRRKRAEQATRDAEARYRNLIELSPDGVLVQSNGVVEYANPAAARLLGAAGAGQLVGHNLVSRVEPEYLDAVERATRFLGAGPGQTGFLELRMRRYDGGVAMLEAAAVSYLERGRLVVQTVLRDMSAQIRVQSELAEREQRFRDVVEAAGEYVWETDAAFRYTWLSARIESVLGHMHADMFGRRPQEFMPLGEARTVGETLARHAARKEPFRDLVHRSITKSGRVIWQSVSGVPVLAADGTLKGYRGTGADITARKQAEERIQYLATRDALTGLPNRLLLADRAGQALLNANRNHGRIAVLSFGIDRFQLVNDSLGHQVGDGLLRALSERLSSSLRRDDTLARLGNDQFVLLWDGTHDVQDVTLFARKVLASLSQPFTIEGRSLGVSASIGISVFPGDGRDFPELLKNADAAMNSAKEAGGNTYRFFSPDLNSRAVERLAMENDLRGALARDEFVLHYQPVLRGMPGRNPTIVGAEVLLRWRHPTRGLLSPSDFIPLAESTGQIGEVGAWLVERACERIGVWQSGPLGGLWFALNVSVREFTRERRFVANLERALSSNRIPGTRLRLEIAERSVQSGRADNQEMLRAVAALGVELTIDDFGAAQSSLAYLRSLPLKKLKIDGSLVREMVSGTDAAIIVQTVAAMANGLGLEVAAEGVETGEHLSRLAAMGCREWQGHLFSAPLEAREFERLFEAGASARAS